MAATSGRRDLQFEDLDAVVRDAGRLAAAGYRRVGRWDLAQVCGHLAQWMGYAVDGYPPMPAPVRLLMPVLRAAIGRPTLRKVLATGSMSAGSPTLRQTVPESAVDPGPALAELRRMVGRFKSHEGEYAVSPLFGPMTRHEMARLQRIHCAHHLGFLVPKGEGGPR